MVRNIRVWMLGLVLMVCTAQISYAIDIVEQSELRFPVTEGDVMTQLVVVTPLDSGAAVFNAQGDAGRRVVVSVARKKSDLKNGNRKIKVKDFTFGGSLTDAGGVGIGVFDSAGRLNNIRVGATAVVPANPTSGRYSGKLKLRLKER